MARRRKLINWQKEIPLGKIARIIQNRQCEICQKMGEDFRTGVAGITHWRERVEVLDELEALLGRIAESVKGSPQ